MDYMKEKSVPRNRNYDALYEQAASLIPTGSKVIEFGCGYGRFAWLIQSKCKDYIGIDIDSEALAHAALRVPSGDFLIEDITSYMSPFALVRTYVALEVFEHLEHPYDIDLLKKLPRGSRIIISVPSFDSEDHERYFPNEHDAIRRYCNCMDIDLWRKIKIPTGGGYFHLIRGWR